MTYTLLNTITTNATYTANADGTVTVTNIVVQIGIIGAPAGKFIQSELIPSTGPNAFPIIFPATTTMADAQTYINNQAQAYVTKTYPNT